MGAENEMGRSSEMNTPRCTSSSTPRPGVEKQGRRLPGSLWAKDLSFIYNNYDVEKISKKKSG